MENIKINSEYIKTDQFLKWCGLVSYGSDAKYLIKNGSVKINDEVVLQRGKKLYPGDIVDVSFEGQNFKYIIE